MSTNELQIRLAQDPRDLAAVFVIRGAVFVAEQEVPIEEEWDDRDPAADQFVALLDGVPVGTVRLVEQAPADGTGQASGLLGRLAVLPKGRGSGTGAALVRAVEERARERGFSSVELHAQTHALGFYERLGYTAHGEEFLDAGIPHLHMVRRLG
ncbi:putative GNAT family N-acyltransferase [Nocardiopsis sp. Huas11]|uniref:GNAT family N-acetyltransferase n=1 Tax=Nocardiopsis sp. Huas11 TaxID=2183912 RepID=UPI000EB0A363|nr:GNAT family N-acetyltransferase [Nocardiopsis sp. Huas11]RKS09822.1 putative GNAT family N-acyltransferase [Nocardiopsis sp. Huas11]